jgi:hypothetical protein
MTDKRISRLGLQPGCFISVISGTFRHKIKFSVQPCELRVNVNADCHTVVEAKTHYSCTFETSLSNESCYGGRLVLAALELWKDFCHLNKLQYQSTTFITPT